MEDSETRELSHSGIQFIAQYIGFIPIKTSVRDMGSTEMRVRTIRESMIIICSAAGIEVPIQPEDKVARYVIGEENEKNPIVKNVQVALNVSTKAVSMSHADPSDPNKNGGLVARHPLPLISFAGTGIDTMDAYMGYIAKVKEQRRCHIVRLHDIRVNRVMACLTKAMALSNNPVPVNGWHQQDGAGSAQSSSASLSASAGSGEAASTSSSAEIPTLENGGSVYGQLLSQPWWHGLVSRENAERMLVQSGDFLVRQSGHMPGQVVLSGREGARFQHVLLLETDGEVRTRMHTFVTVAELINYHHNARVPIISEDCSITLMRPITR